LRLRASDSPDRRPQQDKVDRQDMMIWERLLV
jgi:hypothetical protein